MAKEWDKFQADYKKIKPAYEACKSSAVQAMFGEAKQLNSLVMEGTDVVEEAWLDAIKAGAKGTKAADFMGNAGFAGAVKGLVKLCTEMGAAMSKVEAAAAQADTVQGDLKKLSAAIIKDLKSRKDASASKKDIETLQKTCDEQAKDLAISIAYPKKFSNAQRAAVKSPMSVVEEVLKGSAAAAAKARMDRELPHNFTDKVLNGNFKKVMAFYKRITDACDDMSKGKDPAAAAKIAQADMVAMQKIVQLYEKAATEYKDDLANSKDKANIQKTLDTMSKAYKTAVTKLKEAAVAMKALKKAS